MILSAPVPSSFLKTMSGLRLVMSCLNLSLCRVMRPSGRPLAPSVCSGTLGACCLNTSGVILRGPRRSPDPRPGPHDLTPPHSSTVTSRVTIGTDRISTTHSTTSVSLSFVFDVSRDLNQSHRGQCEHRYSPFIKW